MQHTNKNHALLVEVDVTEEVRNVVFAALSPFLFQPLRSLAILPLALRLHPAHHSCFRCHSKLLLQGWWRDSSIKIDFNLTPKDLKQ